MNKNWNDRADKDLFFTILSVKNIGVISGAEWTTIGNHMRSMGYGFTNEGCRQHFQGLRRAQNKAESNGSSLDSQRQADPTANPITRRPGPGRGRPRKVPPAPSTSNDERSPQAIKPASETEASDEPSAPTPLPAHTSVGESEPSSMAIEEPAADDEEQPAKRQRLDVEEEAQPANGEDQAVNDDEAVLALQADSITSVVDSYGPPEYYGEA
ncbi:putative accumulation-associated protein [Rosellinia necatrix]|uniref:Putative accumulation-associated protein n=1 Tax=Rosellinia necatrix TaxID=77044 RepID=A0A1W2TCM4_ROSNE|nr:putative accumulation-associated protein [Rosellinia necatrix]